MTPAASSGAAPGTAADAVATSGAALGSGAEPAGARVQQQYIFEVFTVSAVDCQKLEGVRNTDGPPTAFSIAEETEIPALRCVMRSLGLHRHRDGPKSARFYMHDHDHVFSAPAGGISLPQASFQPTSKLSRVKLPGLLGEA